MTDAWKYQLKKKSKAILLKLGKAKKVEDGKKARNKQLGVLSTMDKTPEEKHNTREVIAEELGWSTGKVAKKPFSIGTRTAIRQRRLLERLV